MATKIIIPRGPRELDHTHHTRSFISPRPPLPEPTPRLGRIPGPTLANGWGGSGASSAQSPARLGESRDAGHRAQFTSQPAELSAPKASPLAQGEPSVAGPTRYKRIGGKRRG